MRGEPGARGGDGGGAMVKVHVGPPPLETGGAAGDSRARDA